MDTASGQGLERQFSSFPTRFPSRRSSMEMTEIILGTSEGLTPTPVASKHVTEEVSGNIERVGPWPLKRAGSSETTIVTSERGGFALGSQNPSEEEPSKGKSGFSALMNAVDQQYKHIKPKGEKSKSASDGTSEILEWTRAQLKRPTAGEIRIVNTSGGACMGSASASQGSEQSGRDTEQQACDMNHALGTCCQQCNNTLQEKESAATRVLWVVFACFLVLVFSPGLIAVAFSKDGKAVIVDVQGNSKKTLRLFFGLLIIPVVAVDILIATAVWSLLLHFGFPANNQSGRQSNRNMIMWFGFLFWWVFIPLMGCVALIGDYITPMK